MARGAKKNTTGTIRIIGGLWRGRKLSVLDAEGLRPTTDRTKETLFNWLMPSISGSRCLDAFAGSGGLGLEALSRGAASVTFLEQSAQAVKQLRQHVSVLKVDEGRAEVRQGDALSLLPALQPGFDVVFVDPPFAKGLADKAITAIDSHKLIAHQGLIYIEIPIAERQMPIPAHWQLLKSKQTQQVHYSLYRNQGE